MPTFRIDECMNSRRLVKACEETDDVKILRFPHELRSTKDPEVLASVLSDGVPFVTTDGKLISDHASSVPDLQPGIVVIKSVEPQTLTLDIAMRILSSFKVQFPNWSTTTFANSVLEISQTYVIVIRIFAGRVVQEEHISFASPDWVSRVSTLLQNNAQVT